MKYVFYAILLTVIAVLSYYIVESIRRPVNFHNTWSARKTVVHKRLEEIVELQKLYKVLHNDTAYAGDFDDMMNTFLNDSFSILKIVGDPYDTLKKADTVRVKYPARDSLGTLMVKFGFLKAEDYSKYHEKAHAVFNTKDKNANEHPDVKEYISYLDKEIKAYFNKIKYVPFSDNKDKKIEAKLFKIESSTVILEGSRLASNYAAPTFEVSTSVGSYMPEFNPEEYSMYDAAFIPEKTVKVGDLTKVTTAGNW
jgi:hypothetical protein